MLFCFLFSEHPILKQPKMAAANIANMASAVGLLRSQTGPPVADFNKYDLDFGLCGQPAPLNREITDVITMYSKGMVPWIPDRFSVCFPIHLRLTLVLRASY
jgi:hypothetical protein